MGGDCGRLLENQTNPTGDPDCNNFPGYDIAIRTQSGGPPAQTGHSFDFFGNISHATIYLNEGAVEDDDFHWSWDEQDCYVGIGDGCRMDAKTIIAHEWGHALGIAHNTSVTNLLCGKFYYSTNDESACTTVGQKTMHWDAGAEYLNGAAAGAEHQGYRHAIKQDDKDALIDIYGAP